MTHPGGLMKPPKPLIRTLPRNSRTFDVQRGGEIDPNLRLMDRTEDPAPIGQSVTLDTTYYANHSDPAERGRSYLPETIRIDEIDQRAGHFSKKTVFIGRVDTKGFILTNQPDNGRTLKVRDHWFLLSKRFATLDASRLKIGEAIYNLWVAPRSPEIWPTNADGGRAVAIDESLFYERAFCGKFYRNQSVASILADLIKRLGNHIGIIDYEDGVPTIRAREIGSTQIPVVVGTIRSGAVSHSIVPFAQSVSITEDYNSQFSRAIGWGGLRQSQKLFDLIPAWDTSDSAGIAQVLGLSGGAATPSLGLIGRLYEIPEAAAGLLLHPVPAVPGSTDESMARQGAILYGHDDQNQIDFEYGGSWRPATRNAAGELVTVFDEVPRVDSRQKWYVYLHYPAISHERSASALASYESNGASVLAGGEPGDPSAWTPSAGFMSLQLQAVAFGSQMVAEVGANGDAYPDDSFFFLDRPEATSQTVEGAYEPTDSGRQEAQTFKKVLRDDYPGLVLETILACKANARPTCGGSFRFDNHYRFLRLGDGLGEIINSEETTIEEDKGFWIGRILWDYQDFSATVIPNDLLPLLAQGMVTG